jgi:hypothetical protein
MAVASLTKMTVPLAGGQSASAQGLLMPKLKFRFRASFLNFGVSTNVVELTKQVQTIKRPSVQFGDITIDVYNSKVKLIGKPEWQDITIKLRDDAGGNVAKLVGEQMQKQFDFMEQASAASGIDYKFQLNYEMLDGGNGANQPNVLETWEIYGAFISQVDYGEFDYSSNEHATIDLTIKYDNALQSPTGTGIGTAVARTIGATITG